MALTSNTNDKLGTVQDSGFTTSWDWKSNYISKLAEDGYERFSQFSATPDSTILFGGPARFTALDSQNPQALIPIGLADGLGFQTNPQLARLYEIGSNRAFFTRGKTQSSLSLSKMLADQANILNVLSQAAYRNTDLMSINVTSAPNSDTNPAIMMNLDSEYFSVPFGLLVIFKTRGGGDGNGKVLSAVYLEYCMFSSFGFQVGSTQPVIAESVSIEYDRPVPVSFI